MNACEILYTGGFCDYKLLTFILYQTKPCFVFQGFYCETEHDFDNLCGTIRREITESRKTPMFELYRERPSHWPPYEPNVVQEQNTGGMFNTDMIYPGLI